MIKIVEPDHCPETLAPRADGMCGCSCTCTCTTGDLVGNQPAKFSKSDPLSFPVIHGKRDGA